MLVGSTDPPGPAQAFDRADDEELAVEMVRVIERLRPATWATILPVTLPSGMEMRSHPELVDEACREYDNRGDEVRAQAAEVRAEALRRLGRLDDEDAPLAVELELPVERGRRRQRSFRLRRSERQQDKHRGQPVEIDGAQSVEAEVVPVAEEVPPSVTPAPAFLVVEVLEDIEPAATTTIDGEQEDVEQVDAASLQSTEASEGSPLDDDEFPPTVELEPSRERGRRRQRSFRLRSSQRQHEVTPVFEEPEAEEHVDTASLQSAEPPEGATEFSERIAGYAFPYQRRSGRDRRSGIDRRQAEVEGFDHASDRRAGGERRSGLNRRRSTT